MTTMFDHLREHLVGVPTSVVAAVLDRTTISSDDVAGIAAVLPDLGDVPGFADMAGWVRYRRDVGRAALMAAVTCDVTVIAAAADDERVQVAAGAAMNPLCTAEILDTMWRRRLADNMSVWRRVAAHPNVGVYVLDAAVAHNNAIIRNAAASNPSLSDRHIQLLSHDTGLLVRATVAANPSVPVAALLSSPATTVEAFTRVMFDAFADHTQSWVAACQFAESSTLTCGEVVEAVTLTCGDQL